MSDTPKGRGTGLNPANRFQALRAEAWDDGWHHDPSSPPATHVIDDHSPGIISHNDSPDVPFKHSINPYRGCEHGCIYCYARPSHAYWGYSAGLDFETRIFAKHDADQRLERAFERKNHRAEVIVIGANTDPYQPIERQLRITRRILELFDAYSHPVALITKSAGILRDLDVLQRLSARKLVNVTISVTTLDAGLARRLEPRAAAPRRRLGVVAALNQAGIPVQVLFAPVIPAINDCELERVYQAVAEAGAGCAGYILLRLPREVNALFQQWLREHYPDRAQHVMSRLRQMRGGQENESRFGERMKGRGAFADLLRQRHQLATRTFALDSPLAPLRQDLFRRPPRKVDQLSLFGAHSDEAARS